MSVAGPQSHDSPARLPGKGSPRTGNAPGAAAGGVFHSRGETTSPPRPPFLCAVHTQAAAGLRANESPFGRQRGRCSSSVSAKIARVSGDFTWVPSEEQLAAQTSLGLLARLAARDTTSFTASRSTSPTGSGARSSTTSGSRSLGDWDAVLDDSRGIEWTTWFVGARLNVANACVHRWASRDARPRGGGLGARGRRAALADVGRALARGAPARRGPARARHRRGRRCRHVLAHGTRGGDRVACVRARRSGAGADLLRLRRAGGVVAARRRGREARPHRGRLVPAREARPDEGGSRRGARRRPERRARPRLAPRRSRLPDDDRDGTRGGRTPSTDSRGRSSRSRSRARRRTCSPTRPGTTGKPKGALHVQGGFLLSIVRETAYQADLRAGDRVLFSTDMGWIMGPWTVVGAMGCGATIVFMEGAPDRPHDRVWRIVADERVTMLGVSPTLVRALIPHGEPSADLSSLRSVVTTGEPWNRGPYEWLDEHVCGGGRIPIVNCSGGTEVGACFLSVTMLAPTKPVSVGFPALGEDMDVFDDRRPAGTRRGRRARLQARLAGDDPRDLGRSGALPRDVLAPLSGRLDARRLGVGRRGRLLVPARPLGRHAQHRRQADRARRARVRGRRRTPPSPRRLRSASRTK